MKNWWKKLKNFGKRLGPGIITGAADDDPATVSNYALGGALLGFNATWLALFSLPFMIAVQEMSARIGLVANAGLVGVMKKHYPKWAIWLIAFIILGVNTFNIAVDLTAMSSVSHLVVPALPTVVFDIAFSVIMIWAMATLPYKKISQYFKWLTFALFAYIAVAFFIKIDWSSVLLHLVWPDFVWTRDNILIIVAVLGTTISPYLFFWQADIEVEERHKSNKIIVTKHELKMMGEDTTLGMVLSNLIAFFIMVTSAVALFGKGFGNISIENLASALTPLAGPYALTIFAMGLVGVGLLAIPVLAGSAAYVLTEAMGWPTGFNINWRKTPAFHTIMIGSMLLGLLITIVELDPLKGLIYSALAYSITAPVMIFALMHIANSKKIMGKRTNGLWSNILGWAAFGVMTIAAILTIIYG
jgi:Mn2+/Fe2+ NRAMP family transporter